LDLRKLYRRRRKIYKINKISLAAGEQEK